MSSDAGWSSLVARRAHNPKVAGSNPAPAIAADQGVGLARALQTGRPGPRRPSVRAAFVVGLPGLNLRAGEPGGFGVHAGRSIARAEPKAGRLHADSRIVER